MKWMNYQYCCPYFMLIIGICLLKVYTKLLMLSLSIDHENKDIIMKIEFKVLKID